jgi:hypothetical protein
MHARTISGPKHMLTIFIAHKYISPSPSTNQRETRKKQPKKDQTIIDQVCDQTPQTPPGYQTKNSNPRKPNPQKAKNKKKQKTPHRDT